MKKLFILPAIVLVVFASCSKKENTCGYTASTIVAPVSEQQTLQDSLTAHGIQATRDSIGFFYTINEPGSGATVANLCSTVAVFYKGSFFNGKIFDSTATGIPSIFQVGQVITGWQKAIPLIAKGGDITLYIPPSLAYGTRNVVNPNTGDTIIPANSNLVFRVALADIQ